jgi:hypothetical protein
VVSNCSCIGVGWLDDVVRRGAIAVSEDKRTRVTGGQVSCIVLFAVEEDKFDVVFLSG